MRLPPVWGRSSVRPQFRDGVAAEEPFFGERAVAVVDGHFGGRVGFGQSNGLADCLFTPRISTPWVIFSFLGHCPTLLGRMNPINVASQHHRFPALYRIHPRTARLGGMFLSRNPQVVSEKKPASTTADTGKVAGGKPATGRLCQAGLRILGECPAPRLAG